MWKPCYFCTFHWLLLKTVVMSLDEEVYWSLEVGLRRASTPVEGVEDIFHGKCPQEPFNLKPEKFQEQISQFLSSLYWRMQDDIQTVEVKKRSFFCTGLSAALTRFFECPTFVRYLYPTLQFAVQTQALRQILDMGWFFCRESSGLIQ